MKTKKYSSDKNMNSSMNGEYISKARVEGMSPAPLNSKQEQAPKRETFKLTHQNSKSKYC